MAKPKLITTRMSIRRSNADRLRDYLGELQAQRDAGDMRQELYDTYIYVLNELDRRGAHSVRPHPKTLIKLSTVYRMRIGKLRDMIAELRAYPMPLDDVQAATLDMLLREDQRRKDHARYIYQKRKKEAECCTLSLPTTPSPAQPTSSTGT